MNLKNKSKEALEQFASLDSSNLKYHHQWGVRPILPSLNFLPIMNYGIKLSLLVENLMLTPHIQSFSMLGDILAESELKKKISRLFSFFVLGNISSFLTPEIFLRISI